MLIPLPVVCRLLDCDVSNRNKTFQSTRAVKCSGQQSTAGMRPHSIWDKDSRVPLRITQPPSSISIMSGRGRQERRALKLGIKPHVWAFGAVGDVANWHAHYSRITVPYLVQPQCKSVCWMGFVYACEGRMSHTNSFVSIDRWDAILRHLRCDNK